LKVLGLPHITNRKLEAEWTEIKKASSIKMKPFAPRCGKSFLYNGLSES